MARRPPGHPDVLRPEFRTTYGFSRFAVNREFDALDRHLQRAHEALQNPRALLHATAHALDAVELQQDRLPDAAQPGEREALSRPAGLVALDRETGVGENGVALRQLRGAFPRRAHRDLRVGPFSYFYMNPD